MTPLRAVAGAVLVAALVLTGLAYRPALDAGFYFDDESNLVDVPAIHWSAASWEAVERLAREALLPHRFVANLSFALNHLAGGLEPRGYHRVNIVIHLAVGLAVAWTAALYVAASRPERAAGRSTAPAAAAAAALFLVHPLATQAVTYVVQRMSSLAALFGLLAFGLYLTARHGRAGSRRRGVCFALAAVAWLLALGSKENALTLLPVVAAYELCFHAGSWRRRLRSAAADPRLRRRLVAAAAGILVLVVLLAAIYLPEARIRWLERYPGRDFSGVERLLTQARVQLLYLGLLAWPDPARLNLDHHVEVSRSLVEPVTTLPAVLFWAGFAAVALGLARRRPRYGFPLVAYLLFHAIEAGPVGLELAFEHRMYLPMAALGWLLAAAISGLRPARQGIAAAAALALALPLAAWTHERNRTWSDWYAFHRDCAEKSPNKYRPHYNFGSELGKHGRYEEAIPVLQRAIELAPERSEAHNQLGNIYLLTGRPARALVAYRSAVRLGPGNAEAHYNLAMVLERRGEVVEAAALYHRFLEIAPPLLEPQRQQVRRHLETLELAIRSRAAAEADP